MSQNHKSFRRKKEVNLYDLGLGNVFLIMTPKAQTKKE